MKVKTFYSFNETNAYEYCECKDPKSVKKFGRKQEYCNKCGKPFKSKKQIS
jgi:hypothetical protein